MSTSRVKSSARVYCLCTLLTTCLLNAQQFPSNVGRQQDLDFISNQLPRLHPSFFNQLDPGRFHQAVVDLAARVETATDAEFYVGLAKLVAMAGDSHTAIGINTAPFQFLPLRFRWFQDGVFVTRASAPYAQALGARLVRLGETPVDEALRQIATVIPHENEAWVRESAPNYLANQTALQGLGLVPAGAASPLAFHSSDGREFTLQVESSAAPLIIAVAEEQGPIPLYQQNANLNYWFSYSAANRLLFMKYNACIEMPDRPFATFAADLLATLDNNPVDTFVFDVRTNIGGSSNLVAPVFNGLAARFSRLSSNPLFRIYDVFNGGTFSSGLLNAEDLLLPFPASIPNPNRTVNVSTRVTSIGQDTGGKPSAYGEIATFRLPASGFPGQYSTRFIAAPDGIPDENSLKPSIAVQLRSTDYFARFDPVMATILGRGTGAPTPSSGDVITVNGASFRTDQGVAPGSFAAAFGSFSSPIDELQVAGVKAALVGGTTSQVNFIVPDSVPLGSATVEVRAAGKPLTAGTVTVSRSGPGIFVTEANVAQPGAILNQDGTLNSKANPAAASSLVQIFATGYGAQPVQVYFAEKPAEVAFSGLLAQFAGLWQVNARIPAGLTGQVPVFFFSDTLPSNGVTLWVR